MLPRPAREVTSLSGALIVGIHCSLYVRLNSSKARRSSSGVETPVRMKRSATPLPSGSRTKLGELRCRRTPPPVESRQPDSSTRGRAEDAARGRRPRQSCRSGRGRPGGSAPGPQIGSRAWPHAGRCTRSCSDRRPRRRRPRPRPRSVTVMSVPHITSGAAVVIVPSCAFGPCA